MVWAYAHPTFPYSPSAQREHILLCEASKHMSATPRRKNLPIKVYCLESERQAIEENAHQSGLSVSRFLRVVGIGMPVRSMADQKAVKALARINADMGRLGGLLKALLTNEERFDGLTGRELQEITLATLKEIQDNQTELRIIAGRLVEGA